MKGLRRMDPPLRGGQFWLLTTLLLWGLIGPAQGRELAADVNDLVEVEIAGVGITNSGIPAVLLQRDGAEKVIPIFIGPGQARAIALGLRGTETPRPLTHDLFEHTLGALKARLRKVYVDDVRNDTFYGMLELEVQGRDDPLRVDSRPSDALALALRTGATIHVAPKVLEVAQKLEFGGLQDKVVKAAGITVNAVSKKLRQEIGRASCRERVYCEV